ncbi:DNA-formamidopyrimidine glycosylase [Megasphaera paucivorans]|uniref:Formamidopyrimidine-DNA glycosylase n=1 Tax=Megasphaera paucivorans TaxID=349095 RepID=A0A1G9Q4G7_9FIRM|nr:DNA-formamidopyrimidine glycosylase [Megasphaera paucivorans]SDM05932.1 DNA-(apurinic or apyrimidinic site) lyase [Megasphaera paucivorans]
MPELPEVETVRRYLQNHLPGKSIQQIEIFLPRLIKNATSQQFAAALKNKKIKKVERRGKYLFLHIDGPQSLLIHLRMTGRLVYEEEPFSVLPRFNRIVFQLTQGRMLYGDVRTLGCLWLIPSVGLTGVKGYDTLGPDGTSPDFTAAYLRQKLKDTTRTIKSFLLDQTNVAGLGNIYVDEALFAARITPLRRCNRIGKETAVRLHDAVVRVLEEGIVHGGTTIRDFINGSGKEGQNQQNLCVYGREGRPCPVCGTKIVYIKLAGRGTHYCPHCQK